MYELCIDTSAGASVALLKDQEVVARKSMEDSRHHAESLVPMIKECLSEAGIADTLQVPWKGIYVGVGPAPFTGLRAGIVTAVTLAKAWGTEVYGVGALEALARSALDRISGGRTSGETEVLVVADARRKEVYWAKYRSLGANDVEEIAPPTVAKAATLADEVLAEGVFLCGPAAGEVEALFDVTAHSREQLDPAVFVRIVQAGQKRCRKFPTEPQYLRAPDIHNKPAS